MKILRLNELHEETYKKASSILKKRGHIRRSSEIQKWGSRKRKVPGEYEMISGNNKFEASIYVNIHFDEIYSKNAQDYFEEFEESEELEELEDEDYFEEDLLESIDIDVQLKASNLWSKELFMRGSKKEVEDKICSAYIYFDVIPNDGRIPSKQIYLSYDIILVYNVNKTNFDIKLVPNRDYDQILNNTYQFSNRRDVVRFFKELKSCDFVDFLANKYSNEEEFCDFLYDNSILSRIKSSVLKVPINYFYKD